MFESLRKFGLAAGAAATVAAGAAIPRPASADTASTVLTGAAIIGGIILLSNANQGRADDSIGYTSNGGRVYGDGRVVMPDGRTFYRNGNGGGYAYANGGNSGGYDRGNSGGNSSGNYGGFDRGSNGRSMSCRRSS